jgi:hypothetical protein
MPEPMPETPATPTCVCGHALSAHVGQVGLVNPPCWYHHGGTWCDCQGYRPDLARPTPPAPGGGEPLYPCDDCGTMRTKAEGGTTFTVCDACWQKHYRRTPAPPASGEELGAKVRAAYDMIQALNDGKRNWIMSIPARVDYDPDIVIHVALRALEAEVARLTRELEEARARIRDLEAKHA